MSDVLLRADGIHRRFGAEVVLDGVSLEVQEGEFVAILGPSGCGKTTLLNVIAGFDRNAERDCLELAGQPIRDGSVDVAVIFQDDSLFPWLTLTQNVLFGERVRRLSPPERERAAQDYVQQFGLRGLESKYPDQLSGGQRQRAAVARALINHPRLLLADEPFRALDSQTRLQSQAFLWREIRSRKQTLCLVTHDIDEALLLADRLVILSPKPSRVVGGFEVNLPHPRQVGTVLSDAFHREKQRFVEYCRAHGLPLFPGEPDDHGDKQGPS